ASPPSAATEPSVYGPATTHATLSAAAAFALAAILIDGLPDESYDDYALDLLRRAEAAWRWAEQNPEAVFYNNRDAAAGVGAGQQETDASGRATDWRRAAVYLFAATGKEAYQEYVVLGHEYTPLVQWHGSIDAFNESETTTMLLYTVLPEADAGTLQTIRRFYREAISRDHLAGAAAQGRSAYRAWLQPEHYTWGSNSIVARQGQLFMNLALYGFEAPKDYDVRDVALGYLNYLHGVNPFGLVYLSNMYELGVSRSVNEFYHSWFTNGSELWDRVGESKYGPAPGFLVGGPTLQYDRDACCPDACGTPENNRRCHSEPLEPPLGQPVLKAYKEFNTSWPLNSWIVTENSNGYQAAYLRLLANFVPPAGGG
ncbi:MAG: glycoside hydrolase family 9 protein, partial [Pseudolabrys sp.]